ncbi:coiled-coil protein [Rhynchospora pubera]|uniref:Coiled-coil protein n=1 Tax=Rhynchospora pubera TaxID=906938 RepID=A0AAV8HTA6_9POAL|nr:coiled-coil protein [Rhynchospora pubera]
MEKTHSRQSSISSDASPPRSLHATSTPLQPHHRRNDSASLPGAPRRRQNAAARAAAQRLARAMASTGSPENSSAEEDDLDDDLSSVHSFDTSTPRRGSIRSSISQTSLESTTPRRRTPSQVSIDLPSVRNRTPSPAMGRYLNEQSGSIRPTPISRTAITGRPSTLPPGRQTLRPSASISASDLPALPAASRREKGMSFDLGNLVVKEEVPPSSLDLQDEIDVLQEQNDSILQKLHEAEERCEAAESKAQQLERKVSFLGDTPSNRIHTLSRKGTMLQQRQANGGDTPKIDVAKSELRSLKKMGRRMILCQEEQEEVMLKRCWLARYWELCKQYGIYADVAEEKYEYWSSVASDPLKTVLSAGKKARDDTLAVGADIKTDKHEALDMIDNNNTKENLLNMILVEKGMRELASLKVEDAVMIALSQKRLFCTKNLTDELLQAEGQIPGFVFDLSNEEKEDVKFKQAWLAYYWRRAKNHGIEEDIAEERLQFWVEQDNHSLSSQDALDVERGLHELKKLGIEALLWEATREGIELADSLAESEE